MLVLVSSSKEDGRRDFLLFLLMSQELGITRSRWKDEEPGDAHQDGEQAFLKISSASVT